ncbi:hypothetical protein [Antarctobacter heliothermus]|uniref:Uncharacterized protein n=1 Tax=Antarctobacter heliothermus TaxID=74033 RepID=A0A239HH53_9RHOB|nr:hypothetical protein [Antarctobacter heliothermus]SNS80660.1 hypothetical protein SAMN04488078_10346 [Antarctobacter heliothermus]
MKENQKSKANAALEALNQAWAYYTPERRPECTVPVYEDLPLAA